MFISPIAATTWAGLGVAGTLVCAWVAQRIGWIQISIARQAHALNLAKAVPQVGCDVRVIKKQVLPESFNPHLVLALDVYNEGELSVSDLTGEWTGVLPGGKPKITPFHRDFLGQCAQFHAEYQIYESPDWPPGKVKFAVHVEFHYLLPGNADPVHFQAKYEYDDAEGHIRRVQTDTH